MQKFATFVDLVTSGFMIFIWGRHNIFVTRFLVMITEIPYTINLIYFTSNQTMDYKYSLIKCCMGINFKVIKPESLNVWAHVTFWLATNVGICPFGQTRLYFCQKASLSSSSFQFLIPPSSSICFVVAFYLSFSYYKSLSTSSLLLVSFFPTLFSWCIY